MSYRELIDNCKKAYKEHNMTLAYQYWCKIFELLEQKLKSVNNEEDRTKYYTEHFEYMREFTDNEVYDITDYGKENSYKKMFRNQFKDINLSSFSGGENLEILENFCEFYEWQPIKTENGFNILDLQLDNLVEEEDYKTFSELINRLVGRAIDYYMDEHEFDEDYLDEEYNNLESLYVIAKKYIQQNEYDLEWLDNVKDYLCELESELKKMKQAEIEKLYNDLGNKIDTLYYYSCLLASGFDKDTAYKNINLLKELWLKDENELCISKLSDMLYEVYDDIDNTMTTRKILLIMYENSEYLI